MRQFSVYALVFGVCLFGLVISDRALATVLSGRIEGTCRIEAVDVCKLNFVGEIGHDVTTPIIATQVRANGVVVSEYRNDAVNPDSELTVLGRTFTSDGFLAARCGQTYTLELQAQASDDVDFKSIATTRGIPCPVSVP